MWRMNAFGSTDLRLFGWMVLLLGLAFLIPGKGGSWAIYTLEAAGLVAFAWWLGSFTLFERVTRTFTARALARQVGGKYEESLTWGGRSLNLYVRWSSGNLDR